MKIPSRDEKDIVKMRSYFYAKMRESDCPERRRRIWNIQKIRWNRITDNGRVIPNYGSIKKEVVTNEKIVERLKIVVRDVRVENV